MGNIVMSWLNLRKSLHLIKLASVLGLGFLWFFFFSFSSLRSCYNMVGSDKVILCHDTAGKSQLFLKYNMKVYSN